MTTSPLLQRVYHWASTAAVFLLFAFLPLSRCEGQQAPSERSGTAAKQSDFSRVILKPPAVSQAPAGTDPSSMSDEQLEKAIQTASASQGTQPWTSDLVKFLTISVLLFGLAVIVIMAILVLRKSQTGDVLRLFTVPMVIVAAVFLVVTGFSNSQITPVIGLLGTLAGYVLGVQSQKAGQSSTSGTIHRVDRGGTTSS